MNQFVFYFGKELFLISAITAQGGFTEYGGYCRYPVNKCNTGYCCTEWKNSSWENPACCSYDQYCDEEWCADDW